MRADIKIYGALTSVFDYTPCPLRPSARVSVRRGFVIRELCFLRCPLPQEKNVPEKTVYQGTVRRGSVFLLFRNRRTYRYGKRKNIERKFRFGFRLVLSCERIKGTNEIRAASGCGDFKLCAIRLKDAKEVSVLRKNFSGSTLPPTISSARISAPFCSSHTAMCHFETLMRFSFLQKALIASFFA